VLLNSLIISESGEIVLLSICVTPLYCHGRNEVLYNFHVSENRQHVFVLVSSYYNCLATALWQVC